jgi:large subunit ribosomal protein L35
MPKIKTHSGAKKRFNLTKTGKVKRARAYKRHQLNNSIKGPKQKRRLRKSTLADQTNMKQIKLLIPYK